MSKWNDEGVILSLSKQGERGLIINALTNNHGRHLGWYTVRSKKTNIIQPGDIVSLKWNARLADQMGLFSIELITISSLENKLDGCWYKHLRANS